MKKLKNIITDLLIAVLFMLLAAVLLCKLVFHIEMKAVLTGSMEPDLPVGSLLLISPAEYDDIEIGDDITFVRDANLTLVTHRVIRKDDASQEITTQGIANNVPDNPTSYANVIGKVIFHIPYAGYLVIWTSDLTRKLLFCILIVVLVVFSLLFSEEKKDPKTQQK